MEKSSPLKIASIVGARPQFVKAAVTSRAIRVHPDIQEILIHTGQHYHELMSDVFFRDLQIPPPDYQLNVGSATHAVQTARMLEAMERVLLAERPDCVLVYGDTNSTLAGALTAAKLEIPVAHVEAGLRSFNRSMPEEINRVVTDTISDLLFAPTTLAAQNLEREGVASDRVRIVGDVMYDAVLQYSMRAEQRTPILSQLRLSRGAYVLATIHRAENTNDLGRLRIISDALIQLQDQLPVVLPVHPRLRALLSSESWLADLQRQVQLIEPVGYLEMLVLEKYAALIATDSGGVQKEAFLFHVPCVTLRDETEWKELIDLGWNRLAPPTDADAIVRACENAFTAQPEASTNPYGDGRSAERIAEELLLHFSATP
jgi:UDP-GlcNAc3NAcA epimerase